MPAGTKPICRAAGAAQAPSISPPEVPDWARMAAQEAVQGSLVTSLRCWEGKTGTARGDAMRTHNHDVDGDRELRPKAARLDVEDPGLIYRTATAGRTDVLDRLGYLACSALSATPVLARLFLKRRLPGPA